MKVMKQSALGVFLFISTSAMAEEIRITAEAPEGTRLRMTVGYQATSESWTCTRLQMEDFTRVPKIFDEIFDANSIYGRLEVSAPQRIEKCNSEQISNPSLEITLPGTNSQSSLGYMGGDVSILQVDRDVVGQQVIECSKFLSANGLTTNCSPQPIKMGPSQTADILVVEKQ